MPLLINLKTNLKSLKYGGDRPGKGNSGQPFIQSKIPDSSFLGTISGPDSIFRGGVSGAVKSSIIDVNRLKLWFQQPVNSLFIDKQNLLSRTAAPAQGGTKQAPKLLNEGIYTPLSTLAQAGVISIGGHLNKQGINPFAGIGLPYTPSLYLDKVKESNQTDNYKDNRLYNLYETHITKESIGPNIISYSGGPGSILGVGKTNIKFAGDQRTGINNFLVKSNSSYFYGKGINRKNGRTKNNILDSDIFALGASLKYITQANLSTNNNPITKPLGASLFNYDGYTYNLNFNTSVYNKDVTSIFINDNKPTLLKPNEDKYKKASNTYTFNQEQIISQSAQSKTSFGSPSLLDFRKTLFPDTGSLKNSEARYIMSSAPKYNTKNIDSPDYIGMDSAGKRGDKSSYTDGKILDGNIKKIIDQITNEGISEGMDGTDFKDLCKFNIGFLNAGNKSIQFRAYLDNISDSYNPSWNSFKYPGRADSFYTYEGFDRKLTLGWTVVALSQQELNGMYEKLNYLASATTAEYSQYGYMKGVLTQLTIGNYIKELPGFINSLTYDISTDTTWEIGIDDDGIFNEKNQLPHVIKISMGYTPIPDQLARFETEPTSTPRFVNMP